MSESSGLNMSTNWVMTSLLPAFNLSNRSLALGQLSSCSFLIHLKGQLKVLQADVYSHQSFVTGNVLFLLKQAFRKVLHGNTKSPTGCIYIPEGVF